MAVANSLTAKKQQNMEQRAEFMVAGEKIILTPHR